MLNQPTLGQVLKDARRAAGLTQEALAARAGLSARAISDLERNVNHAPRPTTVRLLVSALGLSEREREHVEAVAWAHASNWSAVASHAPPTTPEPAGPPPGPAALSAPPLIGRARERALLAQHLAGEGPPLLVLAGEPGIGKTRLLHEAAALASVRGLNVLRGTVPAPGQHHSLDPLADALQHGIQGRSPVLLRRDLQGCAWLVRMLPELASAPLDPAQLESPPPEQAPALIASAVLRFIANTAGPAGTLLALDDLQHADAPALALLARLVRASTEVPLRVIAAYRDGLRTGADQLSSLLAMLAHEQLVRHVALSGLSTKEAADLLSAVVRQRGQTVVPWPARVVHDSGGVPFYLVAWAQHLERLQQQQPAADQVPWPIQQSVRYRIDAGPPAVRPVLQALAVAGGRATYSLLAGLAAQRDQDVLAAIEWSLRERLVNEDGQAYTFAYGVVRTAVEADLSHTRRLLLRRRLATLVARDVQGIEGTRLHHAGSRVPHGRTAPPTPAPGRTDASASGDERAYHLAVLRQAARAAAHRQPAPED